MNKLEKLLIGVVLVLCFCGGYYLYSTPVNASTMMNPDTVPVWCCCPVRGGGMECKEKMYCRCNPY
jgi:hypothetical protein